jgi:hypothetical protein
LDAGKAAELTHQVLVMVFTNLKNGLVNFEPRLVDLMKKLKATEVIEHKKCCWLL